MFLPSFGPRFDHQVAQIRRVQFLEMELEAVFAERRSVGRWSESVEVVIFVWGLNGKHRKNMKKLWKMVIEWDLMGFDVIFNGISLKT